MEQQRSHRRLAQGDGAGLQQHVPDHDDQAQPDELGPVLPADEPAEETEHLDAEVAHPPRLAGDLGAEVRFETVGTDGVDPVQPADQRLRAVGLGLPLPLVERRRPGQIPAQGQPVRGQRPRPRQPEPPVQPEHAGRGDGDQHPGGEHRGDGRADALRHHGHVVADPGQHVAPADLLDPRARHAQHRPDGGLAQPGQQVRAQPPDQVRRDGRGRGAEQHGGHQQRPDRDEHRWRFARDHPVDHLAEDEHRHHLERSSRHGGQHGGGRQPRHLPQVRGHPAGGLGPGRGAQDDRVCGAHAWIMAARGKDTSRGMEYPFAVMRPLPGRQTVTWVA